MNYWGKAPSIGQNSVYVTYVLLLSSVTTITRLCHNSNNSVLTYDKWDDKFTGYEVYDINFLYLGSITI